MKVELPCETPVTKPALVMVATAGLVEIQVPPVDGVKVVVVPIQIRADPVMTGSGLPFMVILSEGSD